MGMINGNVYSLIKGDTGDSGKGLEIKKYYDSTAAKAVERELNSFGLCSSLHSQPTVTFDDRVNYISDEDKKGETFRKYGMCEYDRVAHAAGTKKGERRRCGLELSSF